MPHSYSTTPRQGQLLAEPRFKHDPEWMASSVLPALLNLLIQALGDVASNGFDLSACAGEMQQLRENTCHLHQFLKDFGYVVGSPADQVETKQVWDDLQIWYEREGWIEDDSDGKPQHIHPNANGDKPVLASRLLPGRLQNLHPTLRPERSSATHRRSIIWGLSRTGAKTGGN